MAALVVGCAHVDPPGTTVSLLPDAHARGGTWHWTAVCPFSPSIMNVCRDAAPDLGSVQLAGDEWNLGGGLTTTGTVTMAVGSAGGVALSGDLPNAPPCTEPSCTAPDADTWVRGYPSVLYGINQCNARISPPQSPGLELPMRIGAVPPDLIGTTSYDSQASGVTYDVAYDMWLNPSNTRVPCRIDGTVEVMVWTDYDRQALLPESLKVGTASVPFAVDGSPHSGGNAWTLYADNIDRTGSTAPYGGTVWLVLDKADVVSQGTVSVDLSRALASVGTLLQNNYGWTDFRNRYWLDTIPFGLEFGPASGVPGDAGPALFALNLSSYCLTTGARPSDAGC
jgi:hypothetical protein